MRLIQERQGVDAVIPRRKQTKAQLQAIRIMIAADFTAGEFELMQRGVHFSLRHTVFRDRAQGVEYQGFHFVIIGWIKAGHFRSKKSIAVTGCKSAAADGTTDAAVFQRQTQWRASVAKQQTIKQFGSHDFIKIADVAPHPGQCHRSDIKDVLPRAERHRNVDGSGSEIRGLQRSRTKRLSGIASKITGQASVQFARWLIAVGDEAGVRWAIAPLMEVEQILMRQRRNIARIATIIMTITGIGQQVPRRSHRQLLASAIHRALHFIEDHSFAFAAGTDRFQAMTLLSEIERMQQRSENRVEINSGEVIVIFGDLAGEGIARHVREGHGVHEGLQRPPQHLEKRIAYRIALTAAQRGVL